MEKRVFVLILLMIGASAAWGAGTQPDPGRLRAHVEFLCGLPIARSVDYPPSLNAAAKYIEEQLRACTRRVVLQPYKAGGLQVRNVVASFGPQDGPRLVVGAHYDVCDIQPGADDNASGVAGLLELARLLAAQDSTLKRRIDLVAYTLEEPPHYRSRRMGSWVHAKSLRDAKVSVQLMVSLEMIGYFSEGRDSQQYPVGILDWFYPSTGNYIAVISDFDSGAKAKTFARSLAAGSKVAVENLAAPRWIEGVDFSDHRNYWAFGFPACMVTDTAFYRNPNYHKKSDTPATLNYAKMAEVVAGVYCAITSQN
jgi:Zn-dependent M28 family amino/carboxypeptidase